jgi:DNA-binding transcriptional LysR family regulator
MNLRFVEAFYWASSLKSVTRAAEKLFITQSALSSRIAALEEELGVLLLDRRDKQFRLTVAGARFAGHAQRLLEMQRQIKSEMSGGVADTTAMRVGAIESVVHTWLTEWVQKLRESNPEFELALTVEPTPVLVDQLRRGTLDLAFAALPAVGEGVRTRALAPMEMVFVGHAVMHAKRRYTLEELARFDLLTFQRGSQPHVDLLDLFRRKGVDLPRVHTISSISAMVQLVESGFGVATLPLNAVQRLAERQPIRVLRCEEPLAPLQLHASFRDDPSSIVTQALVDTALALVGQKKNR